VCTGPMQSISNNDKSLHETIKTQMVLRNAQDVQVAYFFKHILS